MKNFEKYEHEISKLVNEDNTLTCSIAFVSGIKKQKMCSLDDDCNECSKECIKWMHSEYKEQILTEEEKEICRLQDQNNKLIEINDAIWSMFREQSRKLNRLESERNRK